MYPGFEYTPERIDNIAEFVADYSLAGLRGLNQNKTREARFVTG
jgi:hypothetical protein